ncbi:MAG TPA: Uma2 family endonuclease [Gemmatimonadaceae bacterium]|nr:Uma2 family endonuclease [Gemmatimonadaceae bacterium]
MAVSAKVWTLAELDALPEDGNRYELVHGELLVSPGPAPSHEEIVRRLHELLAPFVAKHRLGAIYRPRAVVQHGGDQVEPDLQVRAQLPMAARWADAPAPTLVVEVLSPSDTAARQVLKREFYREVGVAEYWVVDAMNRTITMFESDGMVLVDRVLQWHPLAASEVLTIELEELFRDA